MPNRLEYSVLDMGSQNSSDWLWIDLRQIFEVFLKMLDLENPPSDQVLNLSSQDLVVDVKYYFDVILRILYPQRVRICHFSRYRFPLFQCPGDLHSESNEVVCQVV